MFSKEILACLLLALTILSSIKVGAGQIQASTRNSKFSNEQIEAAFAKNNMYRSYWGNILFKIGDEKFKKNPVLNPEDIEEFEMYAQKQMNEFERLIISLINTYGHRLR